jgi:hypothetical protein
MGCWIHRGIDGPFRRRYRCRNSVGLNAVLARRTTRLGTRIYRYFCLICRYDHEGGGLAYTVRFYEVEKDNALQTVPRPRTAGCRCQMVAIAEPERG